MRERPLQKVEADRGAACASLYCARASLRSGGVRKGDGRGVVCPAKEKNCKTAHRNQVALRTQDG
jgi:hypothetical protein